ncbi:MAG: M20/M25/M40 family metallo-hydrolase [Coriobacteriia bacterium]|nr:M20/M25/M40 family metallo-hydrolase [Coriobacteriia bacterium]
MSDERLLSTFLDLARIDSPSRSEARVAAYCATALVAAGCTVHFDDSAQATGSDTGNLIAELTGDAPGVLALSAHMDCVEPCLGVEPVIVDGVISSAGETILGADDKAGLAVAIEVIRRLAESGRPHPTVKALFTVQEEVGLTGAKTLRAEDAASDLCLVLDAAGPAGSIIVAAPTHYTFTAEFLGRACHAGVAPELGVSAIRMAADAITRMQLGRLDGETTANIGSVHGGTATNVVAERCIVTGECRSLDPGRVEDVRAATDAALYAAANEAGGGVEIRWIREYGGFRVADDNEKLSLVLAACRAAGLTPRVESTGGGSDANVLATMGIEVLALGCGMTDVHSTRETLAIADMAGLARLLESLATSLSEKAH